MPELVLGPLLRHASETEATVWVETGSPCEAEVRAGAAGGRARTFRVKDHHYALVRVAGLRPAAAREYEVFLDGRKAWPEPGSPFPPSVIRTPGDGALKIVFGSCRVCAPHEPPYTLSHEEDARGLGVDALYAMAMRLTNEPPERWPHALVLLGDQVYAHKPPEQTLDFIRSRRDPEKPPGETVANFEEYARLYRDSWGDPAIRWLLSTVPSAMIFDDHEVGDDWNISETWLDEIRREPWWDEQISGGHTSYWVYQHLGNLPPEQLDEDEIYAAAREEEDAWPFLRDTALRVHRDSGLARWSFYRDLGNVRLIVVDSRGGRVLAEGRRAMVDRKEWAWIERHATGGFDHLLVGTSLPLMLGPGMHHLQAAVEKACSGAWGERAARLGENVRRSQDLDHWASFQGSFAALVSLVRRVAAGEKGEPPSTVLVLSGDVHHGYLAEAAFEDGATSLVYQATCSPLRNALPRKKSLLQQKAWTKGAALLGRLLSRIAGVRDAGMSWRLTHDHPWFYNQVATLELDGRRAAITFERAVLDATGEPGLEKIYSRRLSRESR